MTLNLHPKAKQSSLAALSAGLEHIRVNKGMMLEGWTAFMASYRANEALPQTGKVHDELVEYIDDLPLVDFVTEFLRKELNDHIPYDKDSPQIRLTDIPGYEDNSKTASRIMDEFSSLPKKFTFTTQLPKVLFPENLMIEGAQSLSADGRILLPDLLLTEQYPLTHENPNIASRARGSGLVALLLGSSDWDPEKPFYQYDDAGYVGIYGGGNLVDRCERRLESFLGLGLAMRLFSYKFSHENPNSRIPWILHIGEGNPKEFWARFDMDEDTSDVLRHITSFRFNDNYPENQKNPWLLSVIQRTGKIIENPKSKTLMLSAKWFFDSLKGKDQTLQYIRLMTSIEILLGEHTDTSKASLGEILGNRLAYLIGKSHQDRSDVLSEFKKIYGVRSSILHHGQHRLRGSERGYMTKLRSFCERAIEEEARLMLAN